MNRTLTFTGLSALIALGVACPANAGLPAGISGAWYNPAQAGHGLSIEMLSRADALVFWYATDPTGAPLNLYIEAAVEGESLVGRALAPRGMRFGDWDRADLEIPHWGEVRIDFEDCDRATLTWSPEGEAGAEFSAGTMPLRRLTRIAASRCDFGRSSAPPVPAGVYAMEILRRHGAALTVSRPARAAIDPEGRLWAIEHWETTRVDGLPSLPDLSYVGNTTPPSVVVGEPIAVGGGDLRLDVRLLSWGVQWPPRAAIAQGSFVVSGDHATGSASAGSEGPERVSLDRAAAGAALLEHADRTSDFAGRYAFVVRSQFFDHPASIEVEPEGRLCVRRYDLARCELTGRLQLAFTGQAFFDFQLEGEALLTPRRYAGRGWLQRSVLDPERVELVLVGVGPGQDGFGAAGVRE